MNIFQVENLSKQYAEKRLFHQITFGIDHGEKVALIARNGAGKTTLLNIITGSEIQDEGTYSFKRNLSIAYLPQNPEYPDGTTVIDCILKGDSPILKTLREYEKLVNNSEITHNSDYQQQLARLTESMDALRAWDYETRIRQMLSVLKIDFPKQKIETLSGGQKKRVALAEALLRDADLLIMDEPTNHLDVEMIEWLEQYLSRSTLSLFMVTHDRYF
ncbi:MAG: ABC-F family ATP-binding cassette domain-containing protein, partial [Bacteroidales bacterium]|nr:ABC-F family ATP-binding cassette domain-containing protein [Bacteroidales bacterium]